METISSALYQYRDYLIIVYGVLVGVGILWQRHLFKEKDHYRQRAAYDMLPYFIASVVPDKVPKRAVIPFVFGIFVIIGTVVYSSFELSTYSFNGDDWWRNVFKATFLAVILVAKAWMGPALISISIAYGIHLLSHGASLEWMPILQQLLDWIFRSLPDVIYVIYSFVSLSYVAVTSITDSVGD